MLAACTSTSGSDKAAVDLTYTKEGRLIGTFAGRRVDLKVELPGSPGTVSGTVAREPVDANWQIAYDGTSSQTVLPVTLHASLAGQVISLNAVFHLLPNFLFESGTVTGSAGGRPVRAHASSAPGESSSSVKVEGSFAGTPFALYATFAGDLADGLIRGTVGGRPTHLTARAQSSAIHVTGDYSGPSGVFVLATGSLLYFLGGIYSA